MLRDKSSDFEVFKGLMTVIIGEPVKIVELLESESNQTSKKGKHFRNRSKDEDSWHGFRNHFPTYWLF